MLKEFTLDVARVRREDTRQAMLRARVALDSADAAVRSLSRNHGPQLKALSDEQDRLRKKERDLRGASTRAMNAGDRKLGSEHTASADSVIVRQDELHRQIRELQAPLDRAAEARDAALKEFHAKQQAFQKADSELNDLMRSLSG